MIPSLWRLPDPLLLASASPTRLALLQDAGLPVETKPSGLDERAVEDGVRRNGGLPADVAAALAEAKALTVSRMHPDRLVVGADQVLDFEGSILHKPVDRAAAQAQIAALSGRTHRLHSAVTIARAGAVAEGFVAQAVLAVRPLEPEAIALYLAQAGDGILGSVGAYQVEGVGIHLFERIEGDHSTILGLPLIPLLARLRRLGALAI